MDKEKIKELFEDFLKSYNQGEKQRIWLENSRKFREFWKNKILSEQLKELDSKDVDEIIKILDTKARGHTKEDESVARVMIPQGVWEKMFKEINENPEIKSLLHQIFVEEIEITTLINKLYEINENRKNSLTGKSANALNAMNFAFNPDKYLSVVSLNDRERIIEYFEIPNGPNFETSSPGEKISLSNEAIIKWFKSVLGINVTPRTICDFLYISLKSYWRDVPDYQSIMLPLLEFAGDQKEHRFRDSIEHISNFFELSESQKQERLPSGFDRIIDNRVGWARTYLKKAGLLEDPNRGYFKITDRGLDILKQNPPKINVKFLMQFPEFVEFQSPKKEKLISEEEEETKTPQELIEEGIKDINENLASELLKKLRANSSGFFEKVVVELITRMGYGEGNVTGGPYDGGIDGIIYQDILGVDKIYLQAKRYKENNLVSPSMIKNFIASMDVEGATKGIFITASKFVGNVKELCEKTPKTIITIDGEELVELMIKYNVGITTKKRYEIKGIDENYFEE